MKMGGTGSAQEDQIITIQLEQALGVKFTYVPFKGGGEVCVNLVGKHVDSTVNNPDRVRRATGKPGGCDPSRSSTRARIANGDWKDIPTIKEALGADIQLPHAARHLRRRRRCPKDAVAWYDNFLKKVHR